MACLARDRLLVSVARVTALSLMLAGCGVAAAAGGGRAHLAPLGAADRQLAHTPSVFAAVSGKLELRSVRSGRVVKVLRNVGGSWTNNGLGFAPDGRYVY